MKTFFKLWAFFTLMGIMGFSLGCTKSRQKMKPPDIKMITSENVHGVIAPDDDHIWLTGNFGVIFHSSDGGTSWKKQESGIKDSILVDGVFLNAKTGWIVGINGIVLHTTDGGTTWVKQDTGTQRHLFGICFVDENCGWVVGAWSTILHTTDGGTTWQRQTEEADKIFNNVFFVDRRTGWVVGERGVILRTIDAGASWQVVMPKEFERKSLEDELTNPRPSLFSIFFTDRNNGWICGIDGTMLRSTDSGETWMMLPAKTDLALYTVFLRGEKGWAVGDKGAYLLSTDSGNSWQLQEEVIKSKFPFRDIYFSSSQKGWIIGARGTVVHTTDGGRTWKFYSGLSYAMRFFQMPKALEFGGGVE